LPEQGGAVTGTNITSLAAGGTGVLIDGTPFRRRGYAGDAKPDRPPCFANAQDASRLP